MVEVETRKLGETPSRPTEVRIVLDRKYVEKAGFKPGEDVYVAYDAGLILISKQIQGIKMGGQAIQ